MCITNEVQWAAIDNRHTDFYRTTCMRKTNYTELYKMFARLRTCNLFCLWGKKCFSIGQTCISHQNFFFTIMFFCKPEAKHKTLYTSRVSLLVTKTLNADSHFLYNYDLFFVLFIFIFLLSLQVQIFSTCCNGSHD